MPAKSIVRLPLAREEKHMLLNICAWSFGTRELNLEIVGEMELSIFAGSWWQLSVGLERFFVFCDCMTFMLQGPGFLHDSCSHDPEGCEPLEATCSSVHRGWVPSASHLLPHKRYQEGSWWSRCSVGSCTAVCRSQGTELCCGSIWTRRWVEAGWSRSGV